LSHCIIGLSNVRGEIGGYGNVNGHRSDRQS
jgi:hypothetical protein